MYTGMVRDAWIVHFRRGDTLTLWDTAEVRHFVTARPDAVKVTHVVYAWQAIPAERAAYLPGDRISASDVTDYFIKAK